MRVLCVFALMGKFSVSQDNGAPLKDAFAATQRRSRTQVSICSRGSENAGSDPPMSGPGVCWGACGPLLARKHIHAPLTPCRPEGQMDPAEGWGAAASLTWPSSRRDDGRANGRPPLTRWGPRAPQAHKTSPLKSSKGCPRPTLSLSDQWRAWRIF